MLITISQFVFKDNWQVDEIVLLQVYMTQDSDGLSMITVKNGVVENITY
jgi:hypothetical protein